MRACSSTRIDPALVLEVSPIEDLWVDASRCVAFWDRCRGPRSVSGTVLHSFPHLEDAVGRLVLLYRHSCCV